MREPSVKLENFGDLFDPGEAAEPILARPVRDALTEWLTEIWAQDELRAVGISARKRAILSGPPGVGKTTLAHHLAARLGLRMLAVRPERLISKYVGETGQQIGALFDLCSAAAGSEEPVLLLIDEFDSISRQRRKGEQASDDSRNEEVNTLLQRIEQYPGFLIAATNYVEHIDTAIWRRFEMHIGVELPGQSERERIFARYLAPFVLPKPALAALAKSCDGSSPALIRHLCENLKRTLVVGPKVNADMSIAGVFARVLATIAPHPSLETPDLWRRGAGDPALKALPWPFTRGAEA